MTGLEALQIVERDCEDLEQVPYGEFATIEKSLKALEIIKEKNVNVGWFKALLETKGDSYTCYLFWVNYTAQPPLTEEEFNLLKGILNDEQ